MARLQPERSPLALASPPVSPTGEKKRGCHSPAALNIPPPAVAGVGSGHGGWERAVMEGRRAGEGVENSIGAGAQRDLGCSGVSGRPLPPPRPSPAHHRGKAASPNRAESIPSLLPLPVIFPSYPSFRRPAGVSPSPLSVGLGQPQPHTPRRQPGRGLPTLPHFHFVGDHPGGWRGCGLQRARADGGARGAGHGQGHMQDLHRYFGVLREEV